MHAATLAHRKDIMVYPASPKRKSFVKTRGRQSKGLSQRDPQERLGDEDLVCLRRLAASSLRKISCRLRRIGGGGGIGCAFPARSAVIEPCLEVDAHPTHLAEGVGFEPTVGFPTAVFKTAAIDHSAISPQNDCFILNFFSIKSSRNHKFLKMCGDVYANIPNPLGTRASPWNPASNIRTLAASSTRLK